MVHRTTPLEPTLLWIVTGYRIFAAIWLSILGAVAITGDATLVDQPGFVWATIALVLLWATLTTVIRVVRPAWMTLWWLVAIDLVISCWSIVAGEFAGTIHPTQKPASEAAATNHGAGRKHSPTAAAYTSAEKAFGAEINRFPLTGTG